MPRQTLIFVALPNGMDSGKKLKLSLYLTPRLEQGATLANFPDFLNWPQSIVDHGLKFQISCGPRKATVSANLKPLRPDIWRAIFGPTTFVDPYQFPDYDSRLIVSYPVRQALAYLKYAYQSNGTGQNPRDKEMPLRFLEPLSFRDGSKSSLASALSQMRLQIWKEQQAPAVRRILSDLVPESAPAPAALPPDGVPTNLQGPDPVATRDMATRFALFHHMPPAHNRGPLPVPDAGFAKTLDFHKALTVLGSYPSLLRALGLVFDIEVPLSLCPSSPKAGAYGSVAVSKVTPGFTWKLAPQFSLTGTSYWRDKTTFCAAPATIPSSQKIGTYQPGDIFKGLLAMSPRDFLLVQLDLDGAMLKALGLADNVGNLEDKDNRAAIDDSLPSLRSAGISLVADGRAMQLLQSIRDNKAFNQALASQGPAPRPFNARDLVRGYRIDIWSSRTGRWHSLHSRNATYGFGADGSVQLTIPEEGFTQLAAAQPADDPTRKTDPTSTQSNVPQPGTDIYLHERVARWDGWSLSAARPGKAMNRSADPSKALDSDPTVNSPVTPFKMTTSFAVTAGSLPELRFGTNYRLRARAVDLAGNSIAFDAPAADPFAVPADGVQLRYLRFEPVSPPIIVPRQAAQNGRSLECLVIRSLNSDPSLDRTATADTDQRHIAPPRVPVRLAERHGALDVNGRLDGSPAMFQMLSGRDKFDLPSQNGEPLEPGPVLNVGYLPDPIARGAALRDLPNTPSGSNGRIGKQGLRYARLPDVDSRPGSVTYIDFGARPWPHASAFRLVLVEGSKGPKWDPTARVLTVSLPKSGTSAVAASSYITSQDLDLMGVWGWMREMFEAAELSAMQGASAADNLTSTSDMVARLTRQVLEGGHEMITPMRALALVHAVQQPLGRPEFVQLPVVHQPSAPIYASALRNSFTPITAWRSPGSHQAVLLGGLQIHGGSSSRIDLESRWLEVTDDPSLPAPTESVASQQVEKIELAALGSGPIYSDASYTRMVAVYIPQVDILWFSGPFDTLDGVNNPSTSAVAAPVHNFDDTRHRWVEYTAVATSRFQEYFPEPGLKFTRNSPVLVVDVPSSARPTAPDISYVVPTFGWERQETSNVKTSVRFGNGLRIYLNRGWYSSGQDELLGVVLWPSASPTYPEAAAREQYKALFSQWGADPIWDNGSAGISAVPTVNNFPNASASATGLLLAETDFRFDVAGHEVAFDPGRGLWYCDIEVGDLFTYSPFLRLALARYQPHSIQGVELSPVVLADFAQLTPDRSAVLSIDPTDPRRGRLFVGGRAPLGPLPSVVQVTVETRAQNVASDLDWQPAPATAVMVTEDAPAPAADNAVLWSGSVVFAKNPPKGQFRLVIREFETIAADASSGNVSDPPGSALRLIYAAILAYDCP